MFNTTKAQSSNETARKIHLEILPGTGTNVVKTFGNPGDEHGSFETKLIKGWDNAAVVAFELARQLNQIELTVVYDGRKSFFSFVLTVPTVGFPTYPVQQINDGIQNN